MDHCIGCKSFTEYGEIGLRKSEANCRWSTYNKNAECPCASCIIKGMCTTPCEPYEEWTTLLFEHQP